MLLLLADVVKIHFGDIADFFQKGGLTGLEELVLQFRGGIKVVLDGAFGVAADEEDFLDAAFGDFFNDKMDGGNIDNRQHGLGHRLCFRKKGRTKACDGDYGFTNDG